MGVVSKLKKSLINRRPGMGNDIASSQIKPGKQRGLTKNHRLSATFLVIIVVAGAAGYGGSYYGSRHSIATGKVSTTQSRQIISNESQLISQIAKDVGPSVVSVNVTGSAVRQNAFGFGQSVQQQSAGTGIILTSSGIIMTNRHVVSEGTDNVSVTLSDGTELDKVSVLGRTNAGDSLDVAFLKIDDAKGKSLIAAAIGDSSKMQVGDRVVAIGNALGQFQNTVTSGIISGFGRQLIAGDSQSTSTEALQNLFQTDAAINEGNSGGPLVNAASEIIGLNTAIAGNAQSIGFAIPINDIKGLIASVEKDGKLQRPYLGVRYLSVTDDVAFTYNLKVKRGAYINKGTDGQPAIVSGSPAEKAGLKEKDIITSINGTAVDDNNSLTSILGRSQVGDTVTLGVNRDGKVLSIKAKLEAAP